MEKIETIAWENYDKAKYLYHVTNQDVAEKIMSGDDLRAMYPIDETGNTPVIFLFCDKRYAARIADDVSPSAYYLIRINKNAIPRETLSHDFVGDIYTVVSFYTTMPAIKNRYLHVV